MLGLDEADSNGKEALKEKRLSDWVRRQLPS
jgi:hypothetical protein